MPLVLANLVASRLAADITASSDSLQVTPGDGAKFPLLGQDDWFPVAVVNDMAQTEFMHVTGRDGDTLIVERGAEGSFPRAYAAGDVVELRLTVAALEALKAEAALP